ncbi:MAG TPA: sensor histidine kinase [Gemmatimonadaceae bacterium]|nr:sensor histidine kinase [Gemmatimonadaceae bacterium]
MRLLPRSNELGWTPYAWLIYLAIIPLYLVFARASVLDWVASVVGIVAFLALYFAGYWIRGPRVLAIVGGIHLLGTIGVAITWGSSCYFIYAAAFLGRAGPPRTAFKLLAGYLGILGIQAWLLDYPIAVWLPALVFSALIGGVNVHFAQVSDANARLRLAHDEIERLAAVAERERIARDLHDVLGHTLSVIILKAELASKLAGRDPLRAATEIREVERISREALAQVRGAVHGYRARSLRAELTSAHDALRTAGIEVATDVTPVRLAPIRESALALALREGVTNVLRHANATSVSLSIAQTNGACRLEVVDNGGGGSAADGAGLRGMRERIESLGGSVSRTSSGGTRLTVTIPASAASEAGASPVPVEERDR